LDALELDFVGANPHARPEAHDQNPAVVSYFKGPKQEWMSGLKTYGRILYRDLWPGIDLSYSGTVDRLKYEFLVHPGADPGRIRLACRGATEVTVNPAGELEISTPARGILDERPYAYQDTGGRREEVVASYLLTTRTPEQPDTHGYGFRVGEYDRSKPLVLDPAVLVYAGFIGGSDSDTSSLSVFEGGLPGAQGGGGGAGKVPSLPAPCGSPGSEPPPSRRSSTTTAPPGFPVTASC
jgi:hypothetical protein